MNRANVLQTASWKDVAELIGIAAIVASLVFVGLQMKQSQDIAIAAQYHERAALAVENFHVMAEVGVTRNAGRQCQIESADNESVEDLLKECLIALAYLTMADNHLYQYEAGFMDESAWQAQRRLLGVLLNNNMIYQSVFQRTRSARRPSFLELGDQLIEEGKADLRSN